MTPKTDKENMKLLEETYPLGFKSTFSLVEAESLMRKARQDERKRIARHVWSMEAKPHICDKPNQYSMCVNCLMLYLKGYKV